MPLPCRTLLVAILSGCAVLAPPASAQTIVTLATGFNQPTGVAPDGADNVFVADSLNNAIKEIGANGGVTTLLTGIGTSSAVALDPSGNAFFIDGSTGRVFEALAEGGYATIKPVGTFDQPAGIAVDAADDVFITSQTSDSVLEAMAASGYATVRTLASGFGKPAGIAIDPSGNLFVADRVADKIIEIPVAGDYTTTRTIVSGDFAPVGLCLDSAGNIFASTTAGILIEYAAASQYSVATYISYFFYSTAIAVDGSDNVFVGGRGSVEEFLAAGGYSQNQLVGSGFIDPGGLSFDSAGNLIVADNGWSGLQRLSAASGYTAPVQIADGELGRPYGVALDGSGNLFIADASGNRVRELLAAGGYTVLQTIGDASFNRPGSVALDGSGNVFVADTGNSAVKEILAAGGYTSVQTLGGGFLQPQGVALDRAGNLYVADTQNDDVKELPAAGGYAVVNTLSGGIAFPEGLALDAQGDIYVVAPENGVVEIQAVGGVIPPSPNLIAIGSGFGAPQGIAFDAAGDIFIADTGDNVVKEIPAVSPPLVASVLPSARAVQLGQPATVFATMINTGADTLQACQIALPASAPAGLSLVYQTTDPIENTPTGTPDTPVALAGNGGSQSFVVSLRGTTAFSIQAMPLVFSCSGAAPAAKLVGVDTIDLTMSETPTADIITAIQTPTGNGIMEIPAGTFEGAFAVASTNHGAGDFITASVDTGTAALNANLLLCQTRPTTGACIDPPASSFTLNFDAQAINTFSVYVSDGTYVPLAPASSRVFVRFTDSAGISHGSVSVALQVD